MEATLMEGIVASLGVRQEKQFDPGRFNPQNPIPLS